MSNDKDNAKSNKLTDTGYKYSFKTPDPLVLYAVTNSQRKNRYRCYISVIIYIDLMIFYLYLAFDVSVPCYNQRD
jgi:hypothetical protein